MIPVKIVRVHPDAKIPEYKTSRASGADLYAIEDTIIRPGEMVTLRTGVKLEIPSRYGKSALLEVQIRPRSGMAYKTKLRIANPPGTIDEDYRGELHVMIDNIAQKEYGPEGVRVSPNVFVIDGSKISTFYDQPIGTYIIRKGDRIAQAVLTATYQMDFVEAAEEELSDTERGEGGLGHTGVR